MKNKWGIERCFLKEILRWEGAKGPGRLVQLDPPPQRKRWAPASERGLPPSFSAHSFYFILIGTSKLIPPPKSTSSLSPPGSDKNCWCDPDKPVARPQSPCQTPKAPQSRTRRSRTSSHLSHGSPCASAGGAGCRGNLRFVIPERKLQLLTIRARHYDCPFLCVVLDYICAHVFVRVSGRYVIISSTHNIIFFCS